MTESVIEIERRETGKYWVHLMLENRHPFLVVHRKGVGTTHIDVGWGLYIGFERFIRDYPESGLNNYIDGLVSLEDQRKYQTEQKLFQMNVG
mgnify:CR=1 FL=1